MLQQFLTSCLVNQEHAALLQTQPHEQRLVCLRLQVHQRIAHAENVETHRSPTTSSDEAFHYPVKYRLHRHVMLYPL
jgi:hypothetical protein